MDIYIRKQLSISSDSTLDEATKHSAILLHWLLDCQEQMQPSAESQLQLELNYMDIECMFKATLYLYECHARYGDELVEAVLLQCSHGQAEIRRFYDNCERDRGEQLVKQLCACIVNGTRNGHEYAAILHQMYKAYADVQPAWSVIRELKWSENIVEKQPNDTLNVVATAAAMELNVDALKMRALVRRIFQLPNVAEIRIALGRAMCLLDSELFLEMFREPQGSLIYERCHILRQMICDMMGEDTACPTADSFVHNLYSFAIRGNGSNVPRFLRTMLHVSVATALGSYLVSYWAQHLAHLNIDEMQFDGDATFVAAASLDEVLYLTHLLLLPKSPCRDHFYRQLQTLQRLPKLRQVLNKVAYVYS